MKNSLALLAALALGASAQLQSVPRNAATLATRNMPACAVKDQWCSSETWLIGEGVECCENTHCGYKDRSFVTYCKPGLAPMELSDSRDATTVDSSNETPGTCAALDKWCSSETWLIGQDVACCEDSHCGHKNKSFMTYCKPGLAPSEVERRFDQEAAGVCAAVDEWCSSETWLIGKDVKCCEGTYCGYKNKSFITYCKPGFGNLELGPGEMQLYNEPKEDSKTRETKPGPTLAPIPSRLVRPSKRDHEDKPSPINTPIIKDVFDSSWKCAKVDQHCDGYTQPLCCAGLICAHFDAKRINPPSRCIPWPDR